MIYGIAVWIKDNQLINVQMYYTDSQALDFLWYDNNNANNNLIPTLQEIVL